MVDLDLDQLKLNSPLPFIDPLSITLDKVIGEGGNAKVYKSTIKEKEYAVKVLGNMNIKDLIYELKIAKQLNKSKQIIKTFGFSFKKQNENTIFMIIMELLTCKGDLYDLLQESSLWNSSRYYNGSLIPKPNTDYVFYNSDESLYWCFDYPVDKKLEIIRSFTDALLELHSNGIVHGDIKTNNLILYNENNRNIVKIIDLGMATFQKEKKLIDIEYRCGTKGYRSKEQEYYKLHYKSDVYSWGVSVVEIWNGDIWDIDNPETYSSLRQNVLKKIKPIQKNHPELAKLIKDSINPNYEKRPYMETIKKRLDQINFNNDHK
jgi:serine/threonine protein kinase